MANAAPNLPGTPKPRPLTGLRVLDLTRILSGPHCTKQLADLGADVIKLEPPEGDMTRTAQPKRGGISVLFSQFNTGKRSVSVDLTKPEGRALALELAAACDIVVENFRPGVAAKLGLGPDAVRAANPRSIYCSISGWGQTGQAATRRAYAQIVHAEVGVVEFASRKHRREPISEASAHADIETGMQAVAGILAALYHREQTGQGGYVEVSMAETVLGAHEWSATEIALADMGRPGEEQLHSFGSYNAPILALADGTPVAFSGDPVGTWANWVKAGVPDEPRFVDREDRAAHRCDLIDHLRTWVAGFSTLSALGAAVDLGKIAYGPVGTFAELADKDWMRERGALVEVDDRAGATLRLPRSPLRFDHLDAGTRGRAAHQGEHNAEVFGEVLGRSEDEIILLRAAEILRDRRPQ